MIRMFSGILLVLAATWSGVSQADSAQASRGAAEQLTSILKSYETYQADFIQIVVNENGSQV